jgi:hypothetical protein
MKEAVVMDNLTVVTPDQTQFLKCSACNKPILRIFEKTKTSTELYKIVAKCPFCSDSSFPKSIYGEIGFLPADGVALGNVSVDDENKLTTFHTSKRR